MNISASIEHYDSASIEYSENRLLHISKMRFDLECSTPEFNTQTICKAFRDSGQNRHINSCTCLVPLVFLQRLCSLNDGQERSKSDLVSNSPDCVTAFFGMLYYIEFLLYRPTNENIFMIKSASKRQSANFPYNVDFEIHTLAVRSW